MSHQRIEHLDSLRGLAALAVVFGHTMGSYKSFQYEFIYSVTAHSAVVFFFLLSGFVLSRSLLKKGDIRITELISYVIRRTFRLYPMMVVALLFGALVLAMIDLPINFTSSSMWFRAQIINAKSVKSVSDYFNELTMRCQFLNPPLWTIYAEFQCSIALPFLIIIQRRGKFFGIILGIALAMYLIFDKGGNKSSFLFAFYLGHLINVFHPALTVVTAKITKILLPIFLLTWMMVAYDWFWNTLALSLIFALIVHCRWIWLKDFLERKNFRFIGKISFSFYALHMPVLFLVWITTRCLMAQIFPFMPVIVTGSFVFFITVCTTIALATLTERFVERPWNSWGHLLSGFYTRKTDGFWSINS